MKFQGGYVGLIVLIVSIAIGGLLFARMYLTPKPTTIVSENGSMETTTTATGIESAHMNIDSAQLMKDKLNSHNADINKAIGE